MTPFPSPQDSLSTLPPSPVSASDGVRFPVGEIDEHFVKRFREQIHALGAVWIFWGCIYLALSLLVQKVIPWFALPMGQAMIGAAVGLTWLVLGVYAIDKRLLALKVGRVLCYASLAFEIGMWVVQATQNQVGPLPVFPVMIGIYVLRQCQRVLRWGNEMQQAGVPLTLRPSR